MQDGKRVIPPFRIPSCLLQLDAEERNVGARHPENHAAHVDRDNDGLNHLVPREMLEAVKKLTRINREIANDSTTWRGDTLPARKY